MEDDQVDDAAVLRRRFAARVAVGVGVGVRVGVMVRVGVAVRACVGVRVGAVLRVGVGVRGCVGVRVASACVIVGVGVGAVGPAGVGVAVAAGPLAPTVSVTVPRFESVEPSHAAKVNVSLPVKPASGKYVATVPFSPVVPCVGCDTIRSVSVLPSGSVASSEIVTGVFTLVEAAASLTTAGRLGLALSFEGPE